MNAYEAFRDALVARNKAKLRELGLDDAWRRPAPPRTAPHLRRAPQRRPKTAQLPITKRVRRREPRPGQYREGSSGASDDESSSCAGSLYTPSLDSMEPENDDMMFDIDSDEGRWDEALREVRLPGGWGAPVRRAT